MVLPRVTNIKVIAIAASTGGTEALEKVLKQLPADLPPILIVQHMPTGFTKLFADRLNTICSMEVHEALNHEDIAAGTALVAPADVHMKLVRLQGKYSVECFAGQKIHGVMPAADILFESVADCVGNAGIGVVLTGMGADGARGLLAMRQKGAKTIAQDEASSVVYGMPKAAYDMGAACFVLPLEIITQKILNLL